MSVPSSDLSLSVEGLEHYSKDQLVHELINRQTFVGVVIYCRQDAKLGKVEPGEIVFTKSPPLPPEGVEYLLRTAQSLVPGMFVDPAAALPTDRTVLRIDAGNVVRVGTTRITLDLLVEQYESGATPEDIVRAYDTLTLADVYSAIGFYLNNREWVAEYLGRRVQEAQSLRERVDSSRPSLTREELEARRASREADHAATGH
jgi:uncharacterized protein (DUF433 family)